MDVQDRFRVQLGEEFRGAVEVIYDLYSDMIGTTSTRRNESKIKFENEKADK